jgi:ubiquinone/menaquinone biosynthesis C-methylase UbiE
MEKEKLILDACCGSRMFWFDKENPNVLFADIRKESHTLCDGRALHINPDVIHNFTNMPFPDNTFKMVVFDPPHLDNAGKTSFMAKKYGNLLPTWEDDIRNGLNECMRVVEPYGTVIFKWNEARITLNKVLSVIDHKPLFGHVTGKHGRTIWMAFMKGV